MIKTKKFTSYSLQYVSDRANSLGLLDIALVLNNSASENLLRTRLFASGSALLDILSRHELQQLFDLTKQTSKRT